MVGAVGHEAGQVLDAVVGGPLGVHGDAGGVGVHAAQRIVVLIGVIGHVQRLVGGQLEGDHAEGVAVGVGISDGLVAGDAGGAGAVVNGDGLAQLLLQRGGERAQAAVGAAARGPGVDGGQALGGEVLGKGRGHAADHDDRNDESKDFRHDGFPPPRIG